MKEVTASSANAGSSGALASKASQCAVASAQSRPRMALRAAVTRSLRSSGNASKASSSKVLVTSGCCWLMLSLMAPR